MSLCLGGAVAMSPRCALRRALAFAPLALVEHARRPSTVVACVAVGVTVWAEDALLPAKRGLSTGRPASSGVYLLTMFFHGAPFSGVWDRTRGGCHFFARGGMLFRVVHPGTRWGATRLGPGACVFVLVWRPCLWCAVARVSA